MQILAIKHSICNNYTTSHKLIIATTTKNLIISNRQKTLEVNDEWYINESMKIKMKNMLYIHSDFPIMHFPCIFETTGSLKSLSLCLNLSLSISLSMEMTGWNTCRSTVT